MDHQENSGLLQSFLDFLLDEGQNADAVNFGKILSS
jgi:hypothetical protein